MTTKLNTQWLRLKSIIVNAKHKLSNHNIIMCNMKNGYNILSSHIYLSEIFAYVFFPRIHQPFLSKCMLQMRKHRTLNLIRICLWWTKVSEAVCKRDWHNVRLYLFINVQHFRLKNVKQWIVRYKLRIARRKLWPVRNKVIILCSSFFFIPWYKCASILYTRTNGIFPCLL